MIKGAETWSEYIDRFADPKYYVLDEVSRKRARLSFQFIAEMTQLREGPKGLSEGSQIGRDVVANSLNNLKTKGIILMPLGIEQTTELHLQLFGGANYRIAAIPNSDASRVLAALRAGLALTAGLVDPDCGAS